MLAAGGAIDPFWSLYGQHKTDEVCNSCLAFADSSKVAKILEGMGEGGKREGREKRTNHGQGRGMGKEMNLPLNLGQGRREGGGRKKTCTNPAKAT